MAEAWSLKRLFLTAEGLAGWLAQPYAPVVIPPQITLIPPFNSSPPTHERSFAALSSSATQKPSEDILALPLNEFVDSVAVRTE